MFHKEGHKIIIVSFLLSAIFTILIENFITTYNIKITLQTCSFFFLKYSFSKTSLIITTLPSTSRFFSATSFDI